MKTFGVVGEENKKSTRKKMTKIWPPKVATIILAFAS
jgi:hypothetical protein